MVETTYYGGKSGDLWELVKLTVRDRVKGMLGRVTCSGAICCRTMRRRGSIAGGRWRQTWRTRGSCTRALCRERMTSGWGSTMRQEMLSRMSFRLPECETGVSRLEAYHTARETSGGLARNVPVHDINSHAAAALRTMGEAGMAGLLPGSGSSALGRVGGKMFSKAGLQALKGLVTSHG